MAIDPITLQIVHNGLRSIADECFIALAKSAYSTNIKERRDCSAAILDRKGRLIAQAENSLPIHISSMLGVLGAVLRKHPIERIRDGDLFAANDPHAAGGTHLPDVCLAQPLFIDGRLVGFACNIAHHADIGGMSPGSMAGNMTEIYQEGLRIPVIRLFRDGQLDADLFDLMLLNVRVPEERRGDYFAQIAACHLGHRRLGELVGTYGIAAFEAACDEIVARTTARMRNAIGALPDGVYTFGDLLDDDGMGTTDIPIHVRITVDNDAMTVDFAGTAPQVAGNVNVTLNATTAAVCYTLKALLDPHVPNNQGVIDAIDLIAEPGCMLNAIFPAAVANRTQTCQRIADVIIGALAKAIPDAAVGAANGATTTAVFSGTGFEGRPYVYLEALGGGFGGRATKDGKDGVQVHITNTSNLPVEALELEYPLFVESYGFVENSGGAGKYRGGLGLRRAVRPDGHTTLFNGTGERFRHRPWGIFGGLHGSSGRFYILNDDGSTLPLSGKPSNVAVRPDQQLVIETPGAGGYGNPRDRDPALVDADLRSGKLSVDRADRDYGLSDRQGN